MLLDGRPNHNKATNIQRDSNVASPDPSSQIGLKIIFCYIDSPETSFCFKDTLVAANTGIHDPIVCVSSNELSKEDRHLDAKYSLGKEICRGGKLKYDWGCVKSSDDGSAQPEPEWGRFTEEDDIGDLGKRTHDQ